MAIFELLNQPTTLYRYRSLGDAARMKRELDALEKRELHFSILEKLNDPMEGLSRRSLGFRKKDIDKKTFDKIITLREKVGICSFSDTFKNTAMWAHYSDQCSGICIGYRTDSLLDGLDDQYSLVRIQYVDSSPMLTSEDAKDGSRAARKLLSFKNDGWQYEREWRLLSDKESLARVSSPDCISSIRMGFNIEKRHQDAIKKLFAKSKKTALYIMDVRGYQLRWDEI
jgi:hypothetical protein